MSLPWPPAEHQAGSNEWRIKEEWIKFEAAVAAAKSVNIVHYYPRRRRNSGTEALLSSPYWSLHPTAEDREVDKVEDHGSSSRDDDSAPMDVTQDDGDVNHDDSDPDFEIVEPKVKEEKKGRKLELNEKKNDGKEEQAPKPKAEAKPKARRIGSQSRGRDAPSHGPPAPANSFDRAAAAPKEKAEAEANDKPLGSIGNISPDPLLRKSGALSSQPPAPGPEQYSLLPMLPLPPPPEILRQPPIGESSSSSEKPDGKSPIPKSKSTSSGKAEAKSQVPALLAWLCPSLH
jgi:hypothetical protein